MFRENKHLHSKETSKDASGVFPNYTGPSAHTIIGSWASPCIFTCMECGRGGVVEGGLGAEEGAYGADKNNN